MTPTVLIAHTADYLNAARLALAFRAVGCGVQALCRRAHPVRRLPFLEAVYDYSPVTPLRSFCGAIASAAPDLIVACDDWSVRLLHQLYLREGTRSEAPTPVQIAIERSLGRMDAYGLLLARSRLGKVAVMAGVLVPWTATVASIKQLERWLRAEGFPAVIKRDHSSGGAGVAIVHDLSGASHSFRRMIGWRNLARSLKWLAFEHDTEWAFDLLRSPPTTVSVQRYVPGIAANCAVACWNGEVLAGICVEAVATAGPTGRATVLRVVENRGMFQAAERIVGAFGLSGFCGFDFVLEENTGRAHLIEINPRATQTNHLALGSGRDLVAALRVRISGEPLRERQAVTDRDLIVVYPPRTDGRGVPAPVAAAYHDVPLEAPELIEAISQRRG